MEIEKVPLPAGINGSIYLADMPGRNESWKASREKMSELAVDRVYCLAGPEELQRDAPEYLEFLNGSSSDWESVKVEMPARGIPESLGSLFQNIAAGAEAVRSGKTILIHCTTGIGRSGSFAIALLIFLGIEKLEAFGLVADAAAGPVTSEQEAIIELFEKKQDLLR